MTPLVILIGLAAVPVVLLVVLRINAALVFLSLCLGDVLVQFVSQDANRVASGANVHAHVANGTVSLGLLLIPAALTALFMVRTVKGSKRLLNTLPAIGTGLLVALLVVPLLPAGTAHQIVQLPLWAKSLHVQSALVAASAGVCLLSLWLSRPKGGGEKEGKKHKG